MYSFCPCQATVQRYFSDSQRRRKQLSARHWSKGQRQNYGWSRFLFYFFLYFKFWFSFSVFLKNLPPNTHIVVSPVFVYFHVWPMTNDCLNFKTSMLVGLKIQLERKIIILTKELRQFALI